MAVKWIPHCEVIDYAHDDKVDAPSVYRGLDTVLGLEPPHASSP
jgi:hypothetical protein